jgi:hypothetical protein
MSQEGIEGLSKSHLKMKLAQMGMSLDRSDHPKDYYVQLYLDKSNAKNKITRDNTSFYKENNILKGKRKRQKINENKDDDENDSNYEEEEY